MNGNVPRYRARGSSIDGFARRGGPVDGGRQYARRPAVRPATQATPVAPIMGGPAMALPIAGAPRATRHMASNQPKLKAKTKQAYMPLDMTLPGRPERAYRGTSFRGGVRRARKQLFRVAAAATAIVIASGGILFTQGMFSAQKVFRGGAQATALQAVVDPNQLKGEGDGRINVLLLGIGGPGHDGGDLTDTIIVASIDPINKNATLLSIPRDLWVKVGAQQTKINAAYSTGKYKKLGKVDSRSTNPEAVNEGLKVADATVESVLGIDIHYNVLLNFQAFRQAVDTVGGITVNVPEDLYDKSMAWENNRNPLLAAAGTQEMNGKKALIYVRSRHTSSDFARSERQRAVILALKQKVATLGTLSNPLKISGLVSAFGNNATTDLSIKDASRLYGITSKIKDANIRSVDFTAKENPLVTTGRVGNQSVVMPKAGMFNYSAMQMYVRSSLPDGYILKERAKVTVLNGSSSVTLADKTARDLTSFGYNINWVGDAPTKAYTKTVLVNLSGDTNKYTKNYLEQRFGVSATTAFPDSTIQKGTADFILILGNNETSSTQN